MTYKGIVTRSKIYSHENENYKQHFTFTKRTS